MGIKNPIVKSLGFTIIELLIVLVIVLLGMTVVGVNFSKVKPSMQLKTVGSEVVSALRFARKQAVKKKKPISVAFNLSENHYQIQGQNQLNKLPEDLTLTLVISRNNYTGNVMATVVFYPDGSSSGAEILLELEHSKKQIKVNWLTGKVSALG